MKNYHPFVTVWLPVPLNIPFIYSVTESTAHSADFGKRALVPFRGKILTGFIDSREKDTVIPLHKIKPIIDVLDEEPVFDKNMLILARWVADYYVSSVGEVLKAAMPQGTMVRSSLKVRALTPPTPELTDPQKDILLHLMEKGRISVNSLAKEKKGPVLSVLRTLEKKGFVEIEHVLNTTVKSATIKYVIPEQINASPPSKRAPKQAECVEQLKNFPDGTPVAEFTERFGFLRGVVNAIVEKGWARYEDRPFTRKNAVLDQEHVETSHPLTSDQSKALNLIESEFKSKNPKPILLHGITGSGKTRVYIELARQTLEKGKGTLVLVPEIALTPQTTRFFSSAFPGRVAVIHSAMSPGQRHDMWHAIHEVRCDVVIGPRSAVFSPIQDLGLIIVDEEHDQSYKQNEQNPRYHGRDVAVMRAKLLGIPIVLGTATPSMESWKNTFEGKYASAFLHNRIGTASLPEIITVDMREEFKAGNLSSISRILRHELLSIVSKGEKSIILLNRRGFATSIQCKSCGQVLSCPKCAVTLTYHTSRRLGICRMCGMERIVSEHCPECGSLEMLYKGKGTQKIEKELENIAGVGSVIRMDSDTTRTRESHFRLFEEFRKGPAQILLGTQMIAKGLDFPEVTLVGIISADTGLFLPDFRAGERTFQLITQVAGRAGRGAVPGKVVLQTFSPENYAVKSASEQNFPNFTENELSIRMETVFPPFSRLALIEFSSLRKDELLPYAEEIADYLRKYIKDECEILGPVEAPIQVINNHHRMHILIKTDGFSKINHVLRHLYENCRSSGIVVSIDVDPFDFS